MLLLVLVQTRATPDSQLLLWHPWDLVPQFPADTAETVDESRFYVVGFLIKRPFVSSFIV